jgi:hypothetical protein
MSLLIHDRWMHLYKEVGWFHFWKGYLKVLNGLDSACLINTHCSDFRRIGHEYTGPMSEMLEDIYHRGIDSVMIARMWEWYNVGHGPSRSASPPLL